MCRPIRFDDQPPERRQVHEVGQPEEALGVLSQEEFDREKAKILDQP
jgi:hypothetical protein